MRAARRPRHPSPPDGSRLPTSLQKPRSARPGRRSCTPAMTPATNVPWNEPSRSSGAPFAPGPAKPRATITFGVVDPVRAPSGSLAGTRARTGRGMGAPDRRRRPRRPPSRRRRSLPSAAENAGAPITDGPRLRSSVIREARVDVLGDSVVEEVRKPAVRDADRKPVDEHLVAAETTACGIASRSSAIALACCRLQAAEIRARERAPDVQLAPRTKPGEPAG